MAQAFVSTYKNHYRWNYRPRTPLYNPNKLTELEPEGDVWMLDFNGELDEELRNLPKIKEAIHQLYLRRMRSTYQVSFCDNLKPLKRRSDSDIELNESSDRYKSAVSKECDQQDELENELLEYCKKLYGPKNCKIIPPLCSARNVFGYMRPAKLLTPLTIYQNGYGRVGFNILKSEMKKHHPSS